MRLLARTASIAVIAGLMLVPSGCGGKKSARQVAEAFVNAMKSGDTKAAAQYWDYSALGRAGNEDWDTFGKGQRDLIVKEMKWAEKRANELGHWRLYFSRSTKVSDVTEQGDVATAILEGGRAAEVALVRVGEEWFVSAVK